ncbi:AraC family transcriptional regulator [Sphingobacterium shayense]|uniref:AraC family transcriptional regulator n=1 Tax=Sphingobacterium shayense TaxID=626343 RepID=UPI0015534F89|nr:AraC family transcriptional regulator [Sphingobacterium shayense]NQD69669.1 AraC family transcriptional regulator [Sphingobacterium shayense]
MESYYKYLPTSGQDNKWGLTLLNTGCGEVANNVGYPNNQHPEAYEFKWLQGRILQEYQLIYISRGNGVFESKTIGEIKVGEGSFILLFPGEWHRYKPDTQTGWVEYWIGFEGFVIDSLVKSYIFQPANALIYTGVRPEIICLYESLLAQAEAELPGYQSLAGGMILHLLGLVNSLEKQQNLIRANKDHQQLVQKAMVMIRENAGSTLNLNDVANELQTSYSTFRKIFKRHTGLAPGQYLIQLKVDRAKNLLLYTDKLIKEIAYELNFESEYYFSKFFKERTGFSPIAFKKRYSMQA